MRQLHSFLHLAPADRRLLIETGLLLAVVRLGLSLLSFRTLLNLLATISRMSRRSHSDEQPQSDRIAWSVRVASRYVPATKSCLIRALAAHVLLTRRHQPARLQIGVSTGTNSKLQAHAWVESDGKVVIGGSAELESFTPLFVGGLESV